MVKIIKRNSATELPLAVSTKRRPSLTVTATVNDWIAESRKNRLDQDNASRETIAGWTADSKI